MAFGRLLDKDIAIINHYFKCGFNKDEAWRRSGRNHAQEASWKFFRRPEVKAEIKRRMDKLTAKAELTAEELIEDLRRLKDSALAIAKYKKVDASGKLYWDFTGASEEELLAVTDIEKGSVLDPNAAIDKLLKVLGAYKPDRIEAKVETETLPDKELARFVGFLLENGIREEKE